MQLGAGWSGPEVVSASRGTAPPGLVLPLCAVLVLLGLALVANFQGIPERLHERLRGRREGFTASYEFQRLLGAGFVFFGGWGLVANVWRLATG